MFVPENIAKQGNYALLFNQQVGIGSHLQAGGRAEMIDTPLIKALSSRQGRILARTMKILFRGNVDGLLNYAAFRPYAIAEAIRIALGDHPANKIVLDPASGLSPELYWLAQEFTDTQFVEMDVHQVIEAKRAAYYQFGIPNNLRLRPIDLQQRALHDIQDKTVDVMVVLGAYVSHKEFRDLLRYLSYIITLDGYLIVPIPFRQGIDNFTDNSFVFSNIVSTPKGALDKQDDFYDLFTDRGFKLEQVIRLSELAKKQDKPIPADIEIVGIARRV